MKKKLNLLIALFFISCTFNSCSDEITFDYNNPLDTKSDAYVPEGPMFLFTYASSTELIMLNWLCKSTTVDGFIIERSIGTQDNFVEIGRSLADNKTYADVFNFSVNTNYYYRTRSFYGKQISAPSNVAVRSFDFKAPSFLEIKSSSAGNLIINWNSNSNFTTGFSIESRIPAQDSNFKLIAALSPSGNAFYEINGLEKGKLYEFRVCAVIGSNKSEYSNTVTYQY